MLLVHTHRRGTIVQTLNSYSCLSLSYDPSLFMSVRPECKAEKIEVQAGCAVYCYVARIFGGLTTIILVLRSVSTIL